MITLAITLHCSAWELLVHNCRSCSSSSANKINLAGILSCWQRAKWVKVLACHPWLFSLKLRHRSLYASEWGGTSTEASPEALKQQLQGAGANSHLVPGISLWVAAGAVGSRWALGSQETAVEQHEPHKGAASSALVIQQAWFGLLLHWEHLRMKYRSDHSRKVIYLQLFLLSCG